MKAGSKRKNNESEEEADARREKEITELVMEEGSLLKRKKSKVTLSSFFGELLRQLLYINTLVTCNTIL